MSKLIINRKNQWYAGPRDYNIYLDNKKIGEIGNGDTRKFMIEDGDHVVSAKLDWFQSRKIKIHLKKEETTYLKIQSSNLSKFKIPAIILITILAYYLKGIYFLILISILILLLIYSLTLGKSSFLVLKK